MEGVNNKTSEKNKTTTSAMQENANDPEPVDNSTQSKAQQPSKIFEYKTKNDRDAIMNMSRPVKNETSTTTVKPNKTSSNSLNEIHDGDDEPDEPKKLISEDVAPKNVWQNQIDKLDKQKEEDSESSPKPIEAVAELKN